MTEQEQRDELNKQFQEHIRKQMLAQQQAQLQAQQWAKEDQVKIQKAQAELIDSERMLKESNDLHYAAIVAVDLLGGFAKDGKIAWHYKEDFKWFQQHTKDNICVMGRNTYDDIIQMQGDKVKKKAVLPNRQTFVVTSRPLEHKNAIAVPSICEVENHLSTEDRKKKIFLCGGDKIYREGIALCKEVFVTVVNAEHDCDKYFPTKYVMDYFEKTKMFENEKAPDLRFTIWTRKQ